MFHFYISLDTEKNRLMDMFCVPEACSTFEKRAIQYHFPIDLAKKMYEHPRYVWDSELETFLASAYKKNKKDLEKALFFFQTYWEKNEKKYLTPLTVFFQNELPPYRVLLGNFLDAISNWREEDITINAYSYKAKNPLYHTYAVLFELILSQIFIRIRNLKSEKTLNDLSVWGLSELSAFAILHDLFSEFSKTSGTGYDTIDSYASIFLEVIKKNNNITDFINEVLKIDFTVQTI